MNKLSSSTSSLPDSSDVASGMSAKSNRSSSSRSSFGSLRRKKKQKDIKPIEPHKSLIPEHPKDEGGDKIARKKEEPSIPEISPTPVSSSAVFPTPKSPTSKSPTPKSSTPKSPKNIPITLIEPSPLKAIPLLESDKILHHDETPYNDTDPNLPETTNASITEPDEYQPLLHPDLVAVRVQETWSASSMFKSFCMWLDPRSPNIIHYLLLLAIIIATIAYFTFINLSDLVTQSVDFNLASFSIPNINEDGIDSHVVGSIHINYDNVDNLLYRNAMKIGSLLIGGGLKVIPRDALKLYVKPEMLHLAPMHVVDVFLPEIIVDVFNNRTTQLDFITKSIIVEENMVKLAGLLMLLKEQETNLEVQGVFASNITTKFFNLVTNEINVYERIAIGRDQFTPNIDVNTFFLNSTDTEIELSSNVILNNNLPFRFEVDSIDWDLLIHDCKNEMQQIGSWTSDPVCVRPERPTSIDFSGVIDNVPDSLLEKCENGLSPFNTLIQNYVNGKPIQIAVRASESQAHAIPKWMYYVLHNLVLSLDVELPKSLAQVEVRDFIINDMEMELPATVTASETFDMMLKSNISVFVALPFDIDLQVPQFKSKFTIRDSENELIGGYSPSFNYMEGDKKKDETIEWHMELNNLLLNMLDPPRVGKYVNTNINNLTNDEDLYLDLEISELKLELPLFTTELTDLKLFNLKIPRRSMATQSLLLEEIYLNLNVSIQQMFYVGSTNNSLLLVCDFELNNPTNYSIDIPKEIFEIGIQHNSNKIARVTLEDVFIPKHERFNMSTTIEVIGKSVDDKVNLEQFLSKFISESANLTVGFTGLHLARSKGLDELLQQISLKDVPLPFLEFDHSQQVIVQSPFIIGTAIHVLTSEVELTVFNPLVNAELTIDVSKAIARYEEVELGHLLRPEHLIVPPGIYHTQRIPIKINQGIGMDVLKKAINGDLAVEITALLNVRIDDFDAELIYHGTNMETQIRW